MSYEPKVKEWKKEEVEEFAELINEYDIIGVLNMKDLPAPQLQDMRGDLRDTLLIRMTKQRLMKRALEKSDKKNIEELEDHMEGMPALLFSNENPFKLYNILKKNKSKAPIKGGQEAPYDLEIKEGPTPFPPGPIIGELGNLGIPAGVDEGKVAVQKDTVVAEEGEVVSDQLASILTRLGIEPMEVGLDLVAVYEDGEILTGEVLDIDEEEYAQNFAQAASWAFNLSVEAGFPTESNVATLLTKGHGDALSLAREQGVLTDETVKDVLVKAAVQMQSLNSHLDLDAKMEEISQGSEDKTEEEPTEETEGGDDETEESGDEDTEEKPVDEIDESGDEDSEEADDEDQETEEESDEEDEDKKEAEDDDEEPEDEGSEPNEDSQESEESEDKSE